MVSVVDGTLSILKTLNCREETNLWFSPDGDYIVYDFSSRGNPKERDISVLSVATIEEFPVVKYPGDDYLLGWTPDGGSILFASDRSGNYDIWLIGMSDGRPVGKPMLVKQNIGRIHSLGLTLDGSLFYEQTGDEWDSNIYTVEVDFERSKFLGDPQLEVQKQIGNNWSPDWSPEGDYLAYVTQHSESKTDLLHIRNAETGEEEELTPKLAKVSQLHWSPDGRSFLLKGQSHEGHSGWFILDRETENLEPLPLPEQRGSVFSARWFPDSWRVLYAHNSGARDWAEIAQLNLETGREDILLRLDNELMGFLVLSPDGSKLAFTRWSMEEGKPRAIALMTKPLKGGEVNEVLSVDFPEMIGNLAWSNDSRFLIFVTALISSPEMGSMQLWRIRSEQGTPERMGVLDNLVVREPIRVHPRGGQVAFTRVSKRAEIWSMEGLLPKELGSD